MPLKRGGSMVSTQQSPLINKTRMRDNNTGGTSMA